jgi:hypothetical protein
LDESVSRDSDSLEQEGRELHRNVAYGVCLHHIQAIWVIRIGSNTTAPVWLIFSGNGGFGTR